MLNQHYTVVNGRRNCRIAIGADSNPMCYVHDSFRCIVVVDQSQIQSLDPPFLNRFEKQVLTWEAMLTVQQKKYVELLEKWVKSMACRFGDDWNVEVLSFCKSDLFANYSADTLASLVLHHWNNTALLERYSGCFALGYLILPGIHFDSSGSDSGCIFGIIICGSAY